MEKEQKNGVVSSQPETEEETLAIEEVSEVSFPAVSEE